jgi:hypothetical protein
MTRREIESPNYTQVPNVILDVDLPDMGLAELKVTLAAVRYTFGFHRERAKLSIRFLSTATGLTINSVLAGAAAAEARGTFRREVKKSGTLWYVNVAAAGVSLGETPEQDGCLTRCDTGVSLGETKKERKKEKDLSRSKKQNANDELFDAVAEICAVDLSIVFKGGKKEGRSKYADRVGIVASELRGAVPPFTAAELGEFREWHMGDVWRRDRILLTVNNIVERAAAWRMREKGSESDVLEAGELIRSGTMI